MSVKFKDNMVFVEEKVAICFKSQSFLEEVSNYYFNKSVDTLIRNDSDILLEIRVNEYVRSSYDSIDFEYVDELEELIAEAKEEGATLLKIRCE